MSGNIGLASVSPSHVLVGIFLGVRSKDGAHHRIHGSGVFLGGGKRRQFGHQNAAAFIAQTFEPVSFFMRKVGFQKNQGGRAFSDQGLQHFFHPGLIGLRVDLSTDQAEPFGQAGATQHDKTTGTVSKRCVMRHSKLAENQDGHDQAVNGNSFRQPKIDKCAAEQLWLFRQHRKRRGADRAKRNGCADRGEAGWQADTD
jgi:hypothetical protein